MTHGPVDERFRTSRNLSIWWSLALRDAGEGGLHRQAISLPGLPVGRTLHDGRRPEPDRDRSRDERRDFYRILDRFGSRRDLLIKP